MEGMAVSGAVITNEYVTYTIANNSTRFLCKRLIRCVLSFYFYFFLRLFVYLLFSFSSFVLCLSFSLFLSNSLSPETNKYSFLSSNTFFVLLFIEARKSFVHLYPLCVHS